MDSLKQMGPARTPLKRISKVASRNLTFLKRKKGLKKKIEELSILCGVDSCMVCIRPEADQQTSQEQHLDMWPDMPKAQEIIEGYRRLPKQEQDKKKLDNSTFLQQRIDKLKLELNGARRENEQFEMSMMKHPYLNNCLNDLSDENIREWIKNIDAKLEAVDDRIDFLTRTEYDVSHIVGAENIVVPSMEYSVGQPLMEPYCSSVSLNPAMSIPYETQGGITRGHIQPYLDREGYFPRNPLVTTMDENQFGANPWSFRDNNNSMEIPGQWIPCCTVFSPCPEHSIYP